MTRISNNNPSVAMQTYAAKRTSEIKAQTKPMKSVEQPRPIATLDTGKVKQDAPVELYSPKGKSTNRI